MGKPVRLASFDENGINTALQQLSNQIRELAPQTKTKMDMTAIGVMYDYINDILAKLDGFVPVARTVNGFPLSENIALTSDNIEFSSLGRSVTERIEEMQVPVNVRGTVQNFADLPMAGNLPHDGIVVVTDENNNNQAWLYVWADWGSGMTWNATAPFGVDLSNYYTRDETWSAVRIIEDQMRQDRAVVALVSSTKENVLIVSEGMMAQKIAGNNITINNSIERTRQAIVEFTNSMLEGLRNSVVPITRTINVRPLADDVVLTALDIEYRDGVSIWQKLNQLEGALNFRHLVDYQSDLPPPFQNNDGAIVRYGKTGSAEMWVVIQNKWSFAASFAVNMDMWPTRIEVENRISVETANRMTANEIIQNALNTEVERSVLFDDEISARLIREINRAMGAEAQLSADVISMGNGTLIEARNYARLLFQSIQGIFDNKVDRTFQPPLVTGVSGQNNASNAWLTVARVNLDGTAAAPVQAMLPHVSALNVGVMTPAAFVRLWQMSEWIDNFQIGGTYVDSFATRAALNAAPPQTWWGPNDWAIVQEDETRPDGFGNPQTTRYILNASLVWTFANTFGGSMPGLFSNTRAGLIRGTASGSGNVGLADPETGTARVNGWDDLAGQVDAVRSAVGVDPDGNLNSPPTGLNARVTNSENSIASLNEDVQHNSNAISGLSARTEAAEDAIENHTVSIAANTAAVGSLRTEVGNVADGLAGKVDRIDRLGITGAVMIDYNNQGQVVASWQSMPYDRVEGFDARADERAENRIADALAFNGAIRNAIPVGADLGEQGTQAFGQAARNGTATTFARSDHFHELPNVPDLEGRLARLEAMSTVPFTTVTANNSTVGTPAQTNQHQASVALVLYNVAASANITVSVSNQYRAVLMTEMGWTHLGPGSSTIVVTNDGGGYLSRYGGIITLYRA